MTDDAIESLVTRLYAAGGAREATDVDFEVYAEALETTSDEDGLAAGRYLTKHVDLVSHRPSPAMVRQQVQVIMRERDMRRPALVEDTGPPVSREEALAQVALLRQLQQRRPAGSDPQPIKASLPRLHPPADQPSQAVAAARHRLTQPAHDAHWMGDHQFCPPTCDAVVAAHTAADHQFCGPDCIPVAETHAAGDHRFYPPDCAPAAPSPLRDDATADGATA